jgi:hypothetical protein
MTYKHADALIATAGPTPGLTRIGTVAEATATDITVIINGTQIPAKYLDSYRNPKAGDIVVVLQQNSTWIVLGRIAGSGVNVLVTYPSFEAQGEVAASNSTSLITGWTTFYETGSPTATMSVVQDDDAPQGAFVAQINPVALSKKVWLQSQSFDVAAGEKYAVSVYAGGVGLTTALQTVQLYMLGFATSTAVAPAQTTTNLVAQMDVDNAPPYAQISGDFAIPAGYPAFARFAVTATTASGIGLRYDYATVRRIG